MKKYFFIAFCFLSTIAMADSDFKVHIKLTANDSSQDFFKLKIFENPENTNFYEDRADAEVLLDQKNVNVFLYAIVPTTEGGTKFCSTVYDNDILGLPLGFKTKLTEAEYTISFSNLFSEPVERSFYLYDALLNTITPIKEDTTYKFTIDDGPKVVNDRFSIYKPGDLKVCAYYDKVEITDNTGTDNIVITTLANDTIFNVAPKVGVQTIDMSGKDAGHYVLTVNGTNYEFCNKPVNNK